MILGLCLLKDIAFVVLFESIYPEKSNIEFIAEVMYLKEEKDALTKEGYKIEKSQIELTTAMASLGFHRVDINLYPGVKATIKAHIIK